MVLAGGWLMGGGFLAWWISVMPLLAGLIALVVGFGTFRVKDRKSRIARNPRTGEAVPVPPRKVPVFKVSKELKDMVSQG